MEQVLTRFEEESGGHLMVATLCLLECSRHGLLERELLELLGEDETLKPPTEKQFVEKGPDAAQEISKRAKTEESSELATDLSKKLHVTVEETYRKTDFDKKVDDEFDVAGLLKLYQFALNSVKPGITYHY